MQPQQIQKKLESMKGNAYEYAKDVHIVKSYKINIEDEDFTIKTDKNSYSRKFSSADDFFKYWFEKEQNLQLDKVHDKLNGKHLPDGVLVKTDLTVYEKESALADDLIAILKSSITKVQNNPGFINQAKAINNDVNSIINIAKLKLDLLKQMKPRN